MFEELETRMMWRHSLHLWHVPVSNFCNIYVEMRRRTEKLFSHSSPTFYAESDSINNSWKSPLNEIQKSRFIHASTLLIFIDESIDMVF